MSWAKSRDITTEKNILDTNMLLNPWGLGCPASTKEYNIHQMLRAQADQEIYRSLAPSGFITRIQPVTILETSTDTDKDGELVGLLTNGTPQANKIRLGRMMAVVNGYKVPVINNAGSGGVHNDIQLPAPPTAGNRVDLVYLEVWIAELGGTSATVSNTSNKPDATHIYRYGNTQYAGTNVDDDISEVDMEINRRWQLQYAIRVATGVDIDTYPDGLNHTSVVKAFGAAGSATAYTFSLSATDPGLYVAGNGSNTSKAALGTVDGYSYAIPIAAVYRRNTGVYADTNRDGCAAVGPNGGLIASGVSGRPDGFYADQIDDADILSLRHQVLVDQQWDMTAMLSDGLDRLMRGNLQSLFGRGDGEGSDAAYRSTIPLIAQELNSVDAPYYLGFGQYNYQRRIFSDAAVLQQTEWNFTATNATPGFGIKPYNVAAPAAPGLSSSAGGTLTGITIYCRLTYCTDATGTYETDAANEANLAMSTNGTITVASPATQPGATYYNVYMGTASGTANLKKQNASPIAIGTGYTKSDALLNVTACPTTNNAQSLLSITVDTNGLKRSTGAVIKTMANSTNQADAGSLPNSKAIMVYEYATGTEITGTWSGLGTATATFKPPAGTNWSANAIGTGVVAVFGIYYPAGNGLNYRPEGVVAQTTTISGTDYVLQTIGKSGVAGSDNYSFGLPYGVAVDASGNIFVTDAGNHRVVKYNSALVFQAQFGQTGVSGNDNSHLNNPQGISIDSSGNVYVSDTGNHRLVKLSNTLAIVGSPLFNTGVAGNDSSHLNTPMGLGIQGTNLYIADSVNKRIVKVDLSSFTYTSAPITGMTSTPYDVAVDASGQYFIVHGNALERWTSGAVFSARFGVVATPASTNYGMTNPRGVALDSNGYVYVCDAGNHRIVKLNKNLIYVGQYGVTTKTATDKAHLNGATCTYIDAIGTMYIADNANQRIIKTHVRLGCADFPLRQFEILAGGAGTDRLRVWYNYKPYQGIIAYQGSTTMAYTVRALTDLKVTTNTLGSGGRSALVGDMLNGCLTRLPFPSYDGSQTIAEWICDGTSLVVSGMDNSPVLYDPALNIVGSEGSSIGPLVANNILKIAQLTASQYALRGVNTLQRYVDGYGWDNLKVVAQQTNAIPKATIGAFLAVASGDVKGDGVTPVLPGLSEGEIVLVVETYYNNAASSPLYGATDTKNAIDIFRLPNRPIVRF